MSEFRKNGVPLSVPTGTNWETSRIPVDFQTGTPVKFDLYRDTTTASTEVYNNTVYFPVVKGVWFLKYDTTGLYLTKDIQTHGRVFVFFKGDNVYKYNTNMTGQTFVWGSSVDNSYLLWNSSVIYIKYYTPGTSSDTVLSKPRDTPEPLPPPEPGIPCIGTCSGSCTGPCPDGYVCTTKEDGTHHCVMSHNKRVLWTTVVAIFMFYVLMFISIFIGVKYMYKVNGVQVPPPPKEYKIVGL